MATLSYRQFKDEFLLQFAVAVGADTDLKLDPVSVAVPGSYPGSWIQEAGDSLAKDGFLKGVRFLSGEADYKLTGKGLERAEDYARSKGMDLHALTEQAYETLRLVTENGTALSAGGGNSIVGTTSGPIESIEIVKLDPLAQAFRELDAQMALTLRDLRGSNAFVEDNGPEASQRVAELEAGRVLLNAQQADSGLVLRILLPALNWLLKKVVVETTKAGIQKLIALVIAFFTKTPV